MTGKMWIIGGLFVVMTTAAGAEGVRQQSPVQEGTTAKPAVQPKVSVRTVVDANTGLEIRQTADSTGKLTVEVQDQQVSIRKENIHTGARVTLSGGRETVSVVVDDRGVTVSGLHGDQRLDQMEPEALKREQALIGRTSVVRNARALLDRLDLRPTTVSGSALLLTKVLLGTMVGDTAAVPTYRAATVARPEAPRLIKAIYQRGDGPGGCWDAYQDYLSRIWNDFWDCIGHNLDSWLYYACELKWLLQAELAMSWLIACSGGLPVT
jgi:hypothetical protein